MKAERARLGWRRWLEGLGLPFKPSPLWEAFWEHVEKAQAAGSFLQLLKRREVTLHRGDRFFMVVKDEIDAYSGSD